MSIEQDVIVKELLKNSQIELELRGEFPCLKIRVSDDQKRDKLLEKIIEMGYSAYNGLPPVPAMYSLLEQSQTIVVENVFESGFFEKFKENFVVSDQVKNNLSEVKAILNNTPPAPISKDVKEGLVEILCCHLGFIGWNLILKNEALRDQVVDFIKQQNIEGIKIEDVGEVVEWGTENKFYNIYVCTDFSIRENKPVDFSPIAKLDALLGTAEDNFLLKSYLYIHSSHERVVS